MNTTKIIILAAGKGSRMQSEVPKVLHKIGKSSMLDRIITTTKPVDPTPIVVVKHCADQITNAIGQQVLYAHQGPKSGTGAAVMAGLKSCKTNPQNIIIICGDKPFVQTTTLEKMIRAHSVSDATITMGYINSTHADEQIRSHFETMGRVQTSKQNTIQQIIEYADATPQQKELPWRNVSFYCFSGKWIRSHIEKLQNHNAQKELYLTDLIAQAAQEKSNSVIGIEISPEEGFGINTQDDLEFAQSIITKA